MLHDVRRELARLRATEILVAVDERFEPRAGVLLRVELDESYWHLLPEEFLRLLGELPDAAGGEAVRRAIEGHGIGVWHGPAPNDTRE